MRSSVITIEEQTGRLDRKTHIIIAIFVIIIINIFSMAATAEFQSMLEAQIRTTLEQEFSHTLRSTLTKAAQDGARAAIASLKITYEPLNPILSQTEERHS